MKKFLIACFAITAAPFLYADKVPSYTYVGGGYSALDFEDAAQNKGAFVEGSVAVGRFFFIDGGHSVTTGDVQDGLDQTENDLLESRIGFGYKYDRHDGLSWFAHYQFSRWDIEYTDFYGTGDNRTSEKSNTDFDIHRLKAGVRAQFSDSVEINAGYGLYDIEYIDDLESGFSLGLVYEVAKGWQIVLDYEKLEAGGGEDDGELSFTKTNIGFRKSF